MSSQTQEQPNLVQRCLHSCRSSSSPYRAIAQMAQSQWPLINYVYRLMEYLICKEYSPSDIAIIVLISLIHYRSSKLWSKLLPAAPYLGLWRYTCTPRWCKSNQIEEKAACADNLEARKWTLRYLSSNAYTKISVAMQPVVGHCYSMVTHFFLLTSAEMGNLLSHTASQGWIILVWLAAFPFTLGRHLLDEWIILMPLMPIPPGSFYRSSIL
jgi:hypothetical protein